MLCNTSFKKKLLLAFLLATGFLIRCWAISQPNLHLWDEMYHALVEKNIATGSWVPMLYADPLLPYDPDDWTTNHVWLHKPPLGLWLGGLSMKIFGVHSWSHRLPSLILGTLSIFLTFLLGKQLFHDDIGLIAAAIHAYSGHAIMYNSGTYGMDNIDNSLLFFVQASVLLMVLALQKNSVLMMAFSGIALGLAILAKSFPSLIVAGLLVSLLLYPQRRTARHLLFFAVMVGSAFCVAFPWIYYASHTWPKEFLAGQKNHMIHFLLPVYTGQWDPLYHIKNIPRDYGEFAVLALPLFYYALYKKRSESILIISLWISIPYAIFSAAKTNINTLVYYCAPPIFLTLAYAFYFIWEKQKNVWQDHRKILWSLILLGAALSLRVAGEKVIQIGTGLFAVEKSHVLPIANQVKVNKPVVFN